MRRSLGSEAELPWFENQTRFTIKGIKARNIWNFRKYRVYSQGHKVPTGYSIMLRMDVAEYGYWIWSYMCPKYHLGPPPLLKIILISLLMIQRWLTWQLPVPAPASRALSLTVKCLAAAPSPATAFSDITQTKTQTYDNKIHFAIKTQTYDNKIHFATKTHTYEYKIHFSAKRIYKKKLKTGQFKSDGKHIYARYFLQKKTLIMQFKFVSPLFSPCFIISNLTFLIFHEVLSTCKSFKKLRKFYETSGII